MNNTDSDNTDEEQKEMTREQWWQRVWEDVLEDLASVNEAEEMAYMLKNLFSSDELAKMMKRVAIATLIQEGMSYKEISRKLWASPSTINAVKKNLASEKHFKSRYEHDLESKRKRSEERAQQYKEEKSNPLKNFSPRQSFINTVSRGYSPPPVTGYKEDNFGFLN